MVDGVRIAEARDRDTLLRLMKEFYAETETPFDAEQTAQAFDTILGDERIGRVWVLTRSGSVAGYAVMTVGFSMEYGGRDAFLDDLFVRKAHRGFGLGRLAIEVILDECRKLGVRALHLEVDRQNAVAKELYHRFGFVDHDRQLMTVTIDTHRHAF